MRSGDDVEMLFSNEGKTAGHQMKILNKRGRYIGTRLREQPDTDIDRHSERMIYHCYVTHINASKHVHIHIYIPGHILSRIYNCTKPSNRPIYNATIAH